MYGKYSELIAPSIQSLDVVIITISLQHKYMISLSFKLGVQHTEITWLLRRSNCLD